MPLFQRVGIEGSSVYSFQGGALLYDKLLKCFFSTLEARNALLAGKLHSSLRENYVIMIMITVITTGYY